MAAKAYAKAGVDVDLGNAVKSGLGALLRATRRPEVMGRVGGFGGLFRASFKGRKRPVLVASVDGVGTKLKVAAMMGRHDTIGRDLVNHCVNDILTLGAEPLFFLDYIGTGRLEPEVFREIVKGLAAGCAEAGCALLGGETAQMPGLYHGKDYDLVGAIVGVVEEKRIVDGRGLRAGDQLVGLASDGLHTNGYSLARKILFEGMKLKPGDRLPGLRGTIGAELMRVHKSYLKPVRRLMAEVAVKGMAHITGGGLLDNVPRILPRGCGAVFYRSAWRVPRLFQILKEEGRLPDEEAYQVFNMGIGYVIAVGRRDLVRTIKLTGGQLVGEIVKGKGTVQLA